MVLSAIEPYWKKLHQRMMILGCVVREMPLIHYLIMHQTNYKLWRRYVLYDLKLSWWLIKINYSQATSHIRWLEDENTDISRAIFVLVLEVLNHLTQLVAREELVIRHILILPDIELNISLENGCTDGCITAGMFVTSLLPPTHLLLMAIADILASII